MGFISVFPKVGKSLQRFADRRALFSVHPGAYFPSVSPELRPNPQSSEPQGRQSATFLVPKFRQSFYLILLTKFLKSFFFFNLEINCN